jgi:hypothetical protein
MISIVKNASWVVIVILVSAACGSSPDPQGTWRAQAGAGISGTITVTATDVAGATLKLSDGSRPFPAFASPVAGMTFVTEAGPTDTLTYGGVTFERYTPPPSRDTLTLRGTVTVSVPGTLGTDARIALVFITKSAGNIVLHEDPADSMSLSVPGTTATFNLDRARGALGVQRILFGTTAELAIGYVVVYEDRNQNNKLDLLYNAVDCTGAIDCVRGVSQVILASRLGDSTELQASPYALLLDGGWSPALVASDTRVATARTGLVSLDSTLQAVPFDVFVPPSATAVTVPTFALP